MQMRSDFRERQPIGKKPFSGAQLPSPSRVQETEEFEGDFTVLYVTNHKHGYNKMMHGKETVDSLSEFNSYIYSSSVVVL